MTSQVSPSEIESGWSGPTIDTPQATSTSFFSLSSPRLWFTSLAAATALSVKSVAEASWSPTISSSIAVMHEDVAEIPQERYENLRDTCKALADLDEDEALFIDSEALVGGLAFVNVMQAFNLATPKVFSHGGDALVFTWESAEARRYITTVGSEAVVQDFKKGGSNVACEVSFRLDNRAQVYDLVKLLGGHIWKRVQSNDQSQLMKSLFDR